jgi:hypothetical protein
MKTEQEKMIDKTLKKMIKSNIEIKNKLYYGAREVNDYILSLNGFKIKRKK